MSIKQISVDRSYAPKFFFWYFNKVAYASDLILLKMKTPNFQINNESTKTRCKMLESPTKRFQSHIYWIVWCGAVCYVRSFVSIGTKTYALWILRCCEYMRLPDISLSPIEIARNKVPLNVVTVWQSHRYIGAQYLVCEQMLPQLPHKYTQPTKQSE